MRNKFIQLMVFFEDSTLTALVIAIVFISIGQIILRNSGFSGMIWADAATRVLVLWLAFFGAMRASRLQNHIAIDLMSHYGSELIQRITHFIISLFSASVCAIAAFYCLSFVRIEMEDGLSAFLTVPTWVCEAVMPFGMAVIAIRFLTQSLTLPESLDHHA